MCIKQKFFVITREVSCEGEGKGIVHLITCHEGIEGAQRYSYTILGWLLKATLQPFYPRN